jgi:uncharacterized protein (UPF0332 family)
MKLNDLESQGLIERVEPNLAKVKKALERTQKDLRTARATLNVDEEWAYTIAYHAMLRAGRALMFCLEYRPKGKDQHKTVGEFCSRILGEEYRNLINKFHRMRQKRHQFVYEIESQISRTEAKDSIENAKKLVEGISKITKEKLGNFLSK